MMSQLPIAVTDLLGQWQADDLLSPSGAGKGAIRAVERECGYELPVPMREFYLEHDGMYDGAMDRCMFSLWPANRILEAWKDDSTQVGPRWTGALGLAFADFLIDSHRFRIVLEGPRRGAVLIDHGNQSAEVADSFISFLEKVAQSDQALLMFPRDDATTA